MNKETKTKKCSDCQERKPADTKHFFPFDSEGKYLQKRCQVCEIKRRVAKGKEYYEKAKLRAKEKAASKASSVKTESVKTERKPLKPVNELDRLFSLIIRNAHPPHCHNCGQHGEVNELQCGHWIGRTNFNTRHDLRNALPLCQTCNYFDHTHTKTLTKRLIELYGIDIIDELNIKKIERFSPSKGQREFIESMFKTLLKSLTEDKESNVQKLIECQKMIDTLIYAVV